MPKITGIWDLESAGDSWTGDNGVQYKLSFYCRNYINYEFDVGKFCDGKATGEYEVEGETVECNNDEMGGGWIKIFDHEDETPIKGIATGPYGVYADWWKQAPEGSCNEYLFIDEGSTINFSEDPNTWAGSGYDAGKHVLVA